LRLSEERYRAVIEHVNDGVVVFQHAKVVFANQRAAAILAMPPEEILRADFCTGCMRTTNTWPSRSNRDRKPAPSPAGGDARAGPRAASAGFPPASPTIPWDGQTASLTFFSDITESRCAGQDAVRRSTERYRP
jgi:hypothetical protein